MTDWYYSKTDDHLCIEWPGERSCLSSAVLNGGVAKARRVINWKVSGAPSEQAPEHSLQQYADQQGWQGQSIGLMTAASMNSLRVRQAELNGETVEVLLTAGLSNARRAGDPADWSAGEQSPMPEAGTINIVLITSLSLPLATQVELVQIITEAKCALLQQLCIRSPISSEIATGTGTDATVIVSGQGREERWAGKHTPLAELVAGLVMDALGSSISQKD